MSRKKLSSATAGSASSEKIKLAVMGMFMGLGVGSLAAAAMAEIATTMHWPLLCMIIFFPALTGLICGIFSRKRPPGITQPRTAFSNQEVHIGSRMGLHAFLLKFGISRGIFQPVVDLADPQTPDQKSPITSAAHAKLLKTIEKQYPLVTTITYDAKTNAPTSDTISREQLAPARLALLSMDHTKQIPH